jgi:hypothetical protein
VFTCRECRKSLNHREIVELKDICSTCTLKESTERIISATIDPWIHHLEKYDLVDIYMQAKAIGYRLRAANDWSFDLEYQGELGQYQGDHKTFITNEQGKQAARAYLQTRKSEIERGQKERKKRKKSIKRFNAER